ncbi:transcription mediator complex subunit Med12-domain-containing protein [Chiua virens]|nr:transcription mediator complex subunit Med12-domain-containing protein [Chiua virens]
MSEVFARRSDNTPAVPPWTFKMPSRVTLNDAKRQAWFADLADDNVPLHKLGKSVPHGARGHDLLDLLQSNNVAIPRAIWFLRVLGENETVGLRNKPNYNPTQYSIDWADDVTSYLKKQLAEIALPSAPRPGLNIKQSFKGVLLDPDSRDRWVSRFSYCLQLLRPFHADSLVDSRTFLVWLVQQMMTCNLAQAGFVVHLADEYLDGVLASCALTKPFADPCIIKLSEVNYFVMDCFSPFWKIRSSAQGQLASLDVLLETLLQRICIVLPDSFVSPNTWAIHSSLLASILSKSVGDNSVPGDQRQCEVQRLLLENLSAIRRRNDAMLFRNLPPRALERLGSMVVHIQVTLPQ